MADFVWYFVKILGQPLRLPCGFALSNPKSAYWKLLCTSKRGFFDRFCQRWAQSYCTYDKNTFAKRYGKDTFEAGLHYFCMAKIRKRSLLGGFVLFSSSILPYFGFVNGFIEVSFDAFFSMIVEKRRLKNACVDGQRQRRRTILSILIK